MNQSSQEHAENTRNIEAALLRARWGWMTQPSPKSKGKGTQNGEVCGHELQTHERPDHWCANTSPAFRVRSEL